jgi:hypothetical protein
MESKKGVAVVVVIVIILLIGMIGNSGACNDGTCNSRGCSSSATMTRGSSEYCLPCAMALIDRYG